MYWKDYEIENYFITPHTLIEYVKSIFNNEGDMLFYDNHIEDFIDCVNDTLLEMVFNNDADQLLEYNAASIALRRIVLRTIKMSKFAESVFERYAKKRSEPLLLTKSDFFCLVPYCRIETISLEVNEKLNMLVQFLEYNA